MAMGTALDTEAAKWKTGQFQIGDAPNPIGLLYEHNKGIATLAVGFLGFSVGFSDKLVQSANFAAAPWMLTSVWVLLILSVILVLSASANLHIFLFLPPDASVPAQVERYKARYNRAAAEIGIAGWSLAGATAVFAVFGALVMFYAPRPLTLEAAIGKATAFCDRVAGSAAAKWRADTSTLDETGKLQKIALMDATSKQSCSVAVRIADGDIAQFNRIEPKPAPPAPEAVDVATLQRWLQEHGYRPGPVDGKFGRKTAAALARFQLQHNLRGSGRLDENTVKALDAYKRAS